MHQNKVSNSFLHETVKMVVSFHFVYKQIAVKKYFCKDFARIVFYRQLQFSVSAIIKWTFVGKCTVTFQFKLCFVMSSQSIIFVKPLPIFTTCSNIY